MRHRAARRLGRALLLALLALLIPPAPARRASIRSCSTAKW
jgi:hypothetical protein